MDVGKNKIMVDEDGAAFVNFVPGAFEKWCEGRSAAEIDRTMRVIAKAREQRNEMFLTRFDFLATEDTIREWEEALSVSNKEH
jgi:hypothetical protein